MTLALPYSILTFVPTPDIPIVRIQLRYPDEGIFIQRFAPNVTRGGIFLASRSPYPVGAVVGFEVALMQGPPLLHGTGKVTWVREYDPQEPQRAHGMGVQFLQVDPDCRPLLRRLLDHKAIPARFTPASGVPASTPRPAPERDTSKVDGQLEGDPSTWIDDQGMRLATDRARLLASRIDDVESLRARDHDEAATIEDALAELPRLLGPRH